MSQLKRLEKTYYLGDGIKLGPAGMLEQMKADGFTFDTETCPIQLTKPSGWSVDEAMDTITYWQEKPQ